MPFLCSAYKADSSPQQERMSCRGSCNEHKSGTSTYSKEKTFNANSSQTLQPAGCSSNRNGSYDNCQENLARFSLGFDVQTGAAPAADHLHPLPSITMVKRVFCSNEERNSSKIYEVIRCSRPTMSYAKYAQALLCYVALNVVAAVFLGNKPIMPAFFASQFCGAMTIIYWRITGSLPVWEKVFYEILVDCTLYIILATSSLTTYIHTYNKTDS